MEMNTVEMDKVERHGQSVKRVRSLSDMHRVPFGAAENLKDLITALRQNRHFAMDFWALVGELSAREQGTLDDEEMLDVLVEGATSLSVASLPEQEGEAARELRQMLAGVDVGAPAFLPDAIEPPGDGLIAGGRIWGGRKEPGRNGTVVPLAERTRRPETSGPRVNAPAGRVETTETWAARHSIGEALSRLEQTSRELREQLAAIKEQAVAEEAVEEGAVAARAIEEQIDVDRGVHTDAATDVQPEVHTEAEKGAEEVARGGKTRPQRLKPHSKQGSYGTHSTPFRAGSEAVPISKTGLSAPSEAAVAQPEKQEQGGVEQFVNWQPLRGSGTRPVWAPEARAAAASTVMRALRPAESAEAEVFAPQPPHTLSRRGLAIPEEDDDPSIPVPLAGYAESERGTGRRVALAALLLVVLGGGGYAATHGNAVRGVWERARPSLQATYEETVEKLRVLKLEATPKSSNAETSAQSPAPAPVSASGGATSGGATSNAGVASTAPAANGSSGSAANSGSAPQASAGSAPETSEVAATPGTTEEPAQLEPKARTDRESVAVRPKKSSSIDMKDNFRNKKDSSEDAAEPEIAANVVRVPSAAMEANLVASRVPAYPTTAKAEGIQGRVVMEALISKSGTVGRVRVLEGDWHLRSAAEDAVMKWRYRPYLVNGRPVDVATTVRVDFRLPRDWGR
ncbi:energy transducer TonB [Edaphobacter aggregans]|uniref:energy transducer TonB n=1 Tax=Edaphobacter aggregans TaxID=570835 RepID=UPI00068F269D|nr:energy transducer TonB [Edaphobacter aggregans]